MANEVSITIKNLPQIRAAFNKSPTLMTRNLNTAIKKSVLSIQAQSMRNTPVLTGRLRGSHRSLFSNLRGQVGTHTNYDIYVHEGTKYMRARPFLRDAVEFSDSLVNRFFKEAVDDTLSEISRAI